MEEVPSGVSKKGSDTSIVDKGWNIISHNTELLFFIALGFVEILVEAAGYRPFVRLNDLLPPFPDYGGDANSTQANTTVPPDPADFSLIYKISSGLDIIGAYTVHLSLAVHMLLPYPVITEHQKVMLVPWLVVTLLRSVLRELLVSLLGIVLCASQDAFSLPCVQYSALQGAQFCFTLYFWTSMHSFYHFLNSKHSPEARVNSVINSINTNFLDETSPLMQESVDRVLSVVLEEEEDSMEATLVERAAMAWIAREILENGRDYVTDKQFSQYLVVKATMELKQALKELADKAKRTKKKNLSPRQKLQQSLEFMKLVTNEPTDLVSLPKTEAFESSRSLSRRDPIRKIKPLTTLGKHGSSDMSIVTGMSGLSDITVASVTSVDSEAQTEPPTSQMDKLLDMLEHQQRQEQQLRRKSDEL